GRAPLGTLTLKLEPSGGVESDPERPARSAQVEREVDEARRGRNERRGGRGAHGGLAFQLNRAMRMNLFQVREIDPEIAEDARRRWPQRKVERERYLVGKSLQGETHARHAALDLADRAGWLRPCRHGQQLQRH